MNVKVGDWVQRVAYPTGGKVSTQTFEDVPPCALFHVNAIDKENQTITIRVHTDRHLPAWKIVEQTFWAGDFLTTKTQRILEESWRQGAEIT